MEQNHLTATTLDELDGRAGVGLPPQRGAIAPDGGGVPAIRPSIEARFWPLGRVTR
jgi:hypothetical protein